MNLGTHIAILSIMLTVTKRNGTTEPVKFDKVSARLEYLSVGLNVNYTRVAQVVIGGITPGVQTRDLDVAAADYAASLGLTHPDYYTLASRIICSNSRKNTPHSFLETMEAISGRVAGPIMTFIRENADILNAAIDYSRNSRFSYLAYQMLESKYMVQAMTSPEYVRPAWATIKDASAVAHDGTPMVVRDGIGYKYISREKYSAVDNPQHIYMRVAIAARYPDMQAVLRVYDSLSRQLYTHATPTLFNSCMSKGQLLSCFLLGSEDSIEGIMANAAKASIISKLSGGIGIHMHKVRGAGAYIYGTSGITNGLTKQLNIYSALASTWNQGGDKRPGAITIYVEPWHSDVMDMLRRFLAHESDTLRQKLFLALWVPDLFFKKYKAKQDWCLFNDQTAPGLCDVYDGMEVCSSCAYCYNPCYSKVMLGVFAGEEGSPAVPTSAQSSCSHTWVSVDAFTQLYTRYAREGRATAIVKASDIMTAIVRCQQQSGVPNILAKDTCNRLANQKNIGTIRSSNLCTEIIEWSGMTSSERTEGDYVIPASQSYACCTLASINLPVFWTASGFDFAALHATVREITRNLDEIIDRNKYPVVECETNAKAYRPIGIGIQGLADLFFAARIPFASQAAAALDEDIAETIYHAFLEETTALAAEKGPCAHWDSSPLGRGIFHFELSDPDFVPRSARWDWESLRVKCQAGFRNYLGVAYMPTVSTSQLLGNNESFEPFTTFAYTKKTSSGQFVMTNEAFQRHMIELGLWNDEMKNQLILADGDLTGLELPAEVKEIYKSIWDIPQRIIVDRAASRGKYIDQSQSLNLHFKNGSTQVLVSCMLYAWEKGLKTLSYYTRTYMKSNRMKTFTETAAAAIKPAVDGDVCTMEAGCVSCSS